MTSRRLLVLALAVLAAGCAEKPRQPEPEPAPVPASDTMAAPEKKMESQPLKYLAGRNLKPMATKPLNVKSKCSHKDAVGTHTKLDLLVKNAEVKTFAAQVNIPHRGICRFDLKNFEQTATLPQALLKAKDGSGCSVRMWEQGKEVTIAFNSCPQSCEGEAFSYLWPILVDAKSGRCA